jgi:hypothetical protein
LTREQPTRKQKRRRPLWRRLLRGTLLALVWTLIIALIVVAATIDILRKPGGRAFLRDQVLAQTKAMLPGLRIAHIGGSYTDSLLLEGVRLDDRDGKPALGLERLRLLFEPTALGDRTVHVKLIELYRPRITLEKRADGSFNLQHLVVPQKETKKEEPKPKKKKAGAPWSVQLDRLAIVDAQIELPAELVPVGVASHKSDKPGRRLIRLSLDAKLAIKDEHELSADIRLKIDRGASARDQARVERLGQRASAARQARSRARRSGRPETRRRRGSAVDDALRRSARFEKNRGRRAARAAFQRQRHAKVATQNAHGVAAFARARHAAFSQKRAVGQLYATAVDGRPLSSDRAFACSEHQRPTLDAQKARARCRQAQVDHVDAVGERHQDALQSQAGVGLEPVAVAAAHRSQGAEKGPRRHHYAVFECERRDGGAASRQARFQGQAPQHCRNGAFIAAAGKRARWLAQDARRLFDDHRRSATPSRQAAGQRRARHTQAQAARPSAFAVDRRHGTARHESRRRARVEIASKPRQRDAKQALWIARRARRVVSRSAHQARSQARAALSRAPTDHVAQGAFFAFWRQSRARGAVRHAQLSARSRALGLAPLEDPLRQSAVRLAHERHVGRSRRTQKALFGPANAAFSSQRLAAARARGEPASALSARQTVSGACQAGARCARQDER